MNARRNRPKKSTNRPFIAGGLAYLDLPKQDGTGELALVQVPFSARPWNAARRLACAPCAYAPCRMDMECSRRTSARRADDVPLAWSPVDFPTQPNFLTYNHDAPRKPVPNFGGCMIQVEHLTKRFPLQGGESVLAVNDLSFAVQAGEVYGLLGPNGAGKTTTLRMLLGLLRPTSGSTAIAGFGSSEFPDEVKRRVGLVSASAGLYPGLSVREMLLFFADLYGVDDDTARSELVKLSRMLGLDELLDRRCANLSTGQRQRVSLARALIHRPPVMLLDEPTLGLDVIGSQVIIEYIEFLRGEGKAVILTTHHLDDAERLCTRFGLMHRGELVTEGTLAELRDRTGCTSLIDMFLKLSKTGPALSLNVPAVH
jgi:sodium transport system ATP-binding protein